MTYATVKCWRLIDASLAGVTVKPATVKWVILERLAEARGRRLTTTKLIAQVESELPHLTAGPEGVYQTLHKLKNRGAIEGISFSELQYAGQLDQLG